MASIKQLSDRKYKITISNGYRTDGRKICKAKTIQVPDSVPKRGVEQYVYHEAERLERLRLANAGSGIAQRNAIFTHGVQHGVAETDLLRPLCHAVRR